MASEEDDTIKDTAVFLISLPLFIFNKPTRDYLLISNIVLTF